MKKYKMIQISETSHTLLKEWCIRNDKKMSKVVERWIQEQTKFPKDEKSILRVQSNR